MSSKLSFDFSTFRNGLLMGMADAVPGVSGGTIALILGIYNKLIFSLSECLNFLRIDFPGIIWQIFIIISISFYSWFRYAFLIFCSYKSFGWF